MRQSTLHNESVTGRQDQALTNAKLAQLSQDNNEPLCTNIYSVHPHLWYRPHLAPPAQSATHCPNVSHFDHMIARWPGSQNMKIPVCCKAGYISR